MLQGLPVDKHLQVCPQPMDLPTSGPGKFCHYDCTECMLAPDEGPADHPDSHWGKVAQACGHHVGHAQEEHAALEKCGPPGALWRLWGVPADLACILRLLSSCMPRAVGSPYPAQLAPLPIGWSDGAPTVLLGTE